MAPNRTYLITGANCGIGQGLTSLILSRPSTTVIATVRNVEKSSPELSALPAGTGSKLIVVQLDSQKEFDAADAVSELHSKYGIDALDVVIANAGMSASMGPILHTSVGNFRDHMDVNAIGPLLLIQAAAPLLKVCKANPVFLTVSSLAASIWQTWSMRIDEPE